MIFHPLADATGARLRGGDGPLGQPFPHVPRALI
jgi:hypothetical protein